MPVTPGRNALPLQNSIPEEELSEEKICKLLTEAAGFVKRRNQRVV